MKEQSLPSSESSRGIRVDGARLRALRQTLGWTQCDAAARSGYSERLIGKLENGGPVAPRSLQETLQAYNENLADAQRVSPADFIIDETHSGNGDDVKRLTREWFDRVFNQRDLSAIGQFMHPDVVLVAEGETRKGREMIMERAATLLAAFDPLQLRIERLISQGNTAIAYWVVEKKNVSEFLGIPATYKWVKLRGNSLAVYHQGLIVEARDHWDVQDLVQQLTGEPSRPV